MAAGTDIAIAHKDYDVRGGGERVAEHLAETFDAPLYVGRFDLENAALEKGLDFHELCASRWQKALIDRGGLARSLAYYFVWQHEADALAAYDTLILSGNEPLWYVGPDEQTTVAYTHSTPRWFYDLFHTTDTDSASGTLRRLVLEAQRVWYETHVNRPDLHVCNSELVARRVRKYWNLPADQVRVVYPPVNVAACDPDAAPTGDRYLYLGRVTETKRVPWLADQATALDLPLTIAGKGPALDAVRAAAGDTVDVRGYVSEAEKRELLAGATALIMPATNEDFGIVPIEAFASGTPVIGVDGGFTQYQVTEGESGYLFEPGTGDLQATIDRFEREGVAWDAADLARFAENFGVTRFREAMRDAVAVAESRAEVTADYDIVPGEQPALAADGGATDE